MEWKDEASQLANRYVDEVRRICEARNLDPEPIVKKVTQRIQVQVMASGVEVVSADLIRGILAAAGPAESWATSSVPPPLPPVPGQFPSMAHDPFAPPRRQVQSGSPTGVVTCLIVGAVCVGLVFVVGILAAILLPALARAREAARRASCQNNLKQVSLVLQMYANDHDGKYPALIDEPGYMIFGGDVLPNLDLPIFQCPADDTDESKRLDDGKLFLDSDYLYLGYALRDQSEMDALVKAASLKNNNLESLMAEGSIAGPHGEILPLRSDLPDPSSIPVMVEWTYIHLPEGANVVYLDGHVEFVRLGSKFPVTEEFYNAVHAMLE